MMRITDAIRLSSIIIGILTILVVSIRISSIDHIELTPLVKIFILAIGLISAGMFKLVCELNYYEEGIA